MPMCNWGIAESVKWEELLKCVANVCSRCFFCDTFSLCVSMRFLCSKDVGGYPKWLVQYGKSPSKMDDNWGYPYFRKTLYVFKVCIFSKRQCVWLVGHCRRWPVWLWIMDWPEPQPSTSRDGRLYWPGFARPRTDHWIFIDDLWPLLMIIIDDLFKPLGCHRSLRENSDSESWDQPHINHPPPLILNTLQMVRMECENSRWKTMVSFRVCFIWTGEGINW